MEPESTTTMEPEFLVENEKGELKIRDESLKNWGRSLQRKKLMLYSELETVILNEVARRLKLRVGDKARGD
ncbi:hypothetical protein Droror1_Dr00006394 [Drosera rotundifolia]